MASRLGLFFPRTGEKWVIDSYRAYLVYFIAEILREEETRKKENGARYPSWITHWEVRFIRDRSSFIVVWRIFGDSLLSTYLSSGETLDRLSMANESFIAPGEKETERDRKKKKTNANGGKCKNLPTYWPVRSDWFLEPLITLSRWRNCRKPTIVRNFWNHLAAKRERETTCRHNCNSSHENALRLRSACVLHAFAYFVS